MNKYDFGYKLQKGTTNYWAYKIIENGSKVLELGSSVGMLTKNLKEKNCIVDIVEIDSESGQKAATFARKSCIGNKAGNIENNLWINEMAGESYDYIVLLDVLEHLHNPKRVLHVLKQFLNESGKIILSVPNIAHNSVLLNLINNKFEYTSVGLLDDTHVHFFTLNSLKEVIAETGYSCMKQECIQKAVGKNEIVNSYLDVPYQVAEYLKKRRGAEVYQFLFVIADKNKEIEAVFENDDIDNFVDINSVYYSDEYTAFDEICQVYYANSAGDIAEDNSDIVEISSKNKAINIELEMEEYVRTKSIRIDPLNNSCVLKDFTVKILSENGELQKFNAMRHNADKLHEETYYFYHKDPQFVLQFDKEISVSKILINFSIEDYAIDAYQLYKEKIRYYEEIIEQNNEIIRKNNEVIDQSVEQMNEIIKQKNAIMEELEHERDLFYNRKIGQRIKDVFKPPKGID